MFTVDKVTNFFLYCRIFTRGFLCGDGKCSPQSPSGGGCYRGLAMPKAAFLKFLNKKLKISLFLS